MPDVTISMEDYKKFLRISASVEAFIRFVKSSQYPPTRQECASFLGFRLDEKFNNT